MKSVKIRRDRKMVSIDQVCKRTGFSKSDIVSMLKQAGFNVFGDGSFAFLNSKQIEVISSFYVDAVNSLFKDLKLNHEYFIESPVAYSRFFLNFIKKDKLNLDEVCLANGEILDFSLENDLIVDFFSKIIYAEPVKSSKSNFGFITRKILKKINFKISKINKDLRSVLSPILISNHYYIFTDDEDISRIKNSFFCFSWNNFRREAFIKFNIYFKQISWKNINYS
ncbi:hypothetical protein ACFSJW_04760 [Flavobacterium artemisiae]|uniref:Uncharacterized protein n=1 Tax=Flavobacterium artemisiae TaxID=2126556 RepID=A0ABW4HJV6_9FLAO